MRGAAEGRREEFHCGNVEGRLLGDDIFAEQSLLKAEHKNPPRITIEQLIDTVCAYYKIKPAELAAPGRQRGPAEARAVVALLVLETENLTLADLGRFIQRELSSLSQGAGRLQKRMKDNRPLKKRVAEVIKSLP